MHIMMFKIALPMCLVCICYASSASYLSPSPPLWPEKFTAVLLQNRKDLLSLTELWYDFVGGRNMNLIQSQLNLKGTLYDLELNNRTSYYYNKEAETCKTISFPVGILTPDWLKGAQYVGSTTIHNISTIGFTKADGFVTYYAEAQAPHRPVRWTFFDGATFDVLIWREGILPDEASWQVPKFCFKANNHILSKPHEVSVTASLNTYFRQLLLRMKHGNKIVVA